MPQFEKGPIMSHHFDTKLAKDGEFPARVRDGVEGK